MEKKYIDRIKKLAALMKKVPKGRFEISQWVTGEFCDKKGEVKQTACGTAACVGGWACTIPEFKRLGLTLSADPFFPDSEPDKYTPTYQKQDSFDALCLFFGLDDIEAPASWKQEYENEYLTMVDYIFGAENSNSPKEAARRIENVIKLVQLQNQMEALKP